MNPTAEKIQIVMNTIQDLDIKSTFNNMNRLMAVLQTLAQIRDELNEQGNEVLELYGGDGKKIAEERPDGETDAE